MDYSNINISKYSINSDQSNKTNIRKLYAHNISLALWPGLVTLSVMTDLGPLTSHQRKGIMEIAAMHMMTLNMNSVRLEEIKTLGLTSQ